jgi:hypothetical protein
VGTYINGSEKYGVILKTTDGGLNWISQRTSDGHELNSVHFVDSNFGWIVGYNFDNFNSVILKTDDGGETWTNQSPNLDLWLISVHFVNNTKGYICGNYGKVLTTTDGGENWIVQISRTDNHLTQINFLDYQTGYMVGTEGTILKTTTGGATFIDEELTFSQPNSFLLSQNFPNPFNPSTTIRYEIPERSFVTIKIYDILGNEITTLVNEEKPAGSYEVEFNISSGIGNLVSGIYFYKLQSGDFVQTKKMVLIK